MKLALKKGRALFLIEILLLAACFAGLGASNAWAKAKVKAVDSIAVTYEDQKGGAIDVYDGDSISIPVKEKQAFTAVAYDVDENVVKTKLTWASSDKKIAKASSSGVVTMSKKTGVSTITVSDRKSGAALSFDVSSEEDLGIASIGVFDENDVEITDAALGTLDMAVDDVMQLTPRAFDDTGAEINVDPSLFRWTLDHSTPKGAVTCGKDGVVTANDIGEANITVSIGAGSFEVTAQFGVSVQ
ncbi:MAG: hypothetical protein HZA01_14840 [Nitrospinae bacterium]|nr:hypothetical protein [Nitrospinota bacterium]